MNYNSMLSDITVSEFIGLIGATAFIVLIGYVITRIILFVLEMIIFLFRKDKYRAKYDCAYLYALKHMAKLRNQVKNARSEKAFYLFYNRMVGAFETYVHLGLFTYKQFIKLCDVRGVYVFNEVQRKIYEENWNNESTQEHTKINPNN